MKKHALAIASLVLAACLGAHAAPTLVNGSLTGPIANGGVPTGWTLTSGSPDTMDQTANVGVPGLPFAAGPTVSPDGGTWVGFGRDVGLLESFSQTISGFTAGASYNLSWYHANFGYDQFGLGYTGANAVEVLIDGLSAGSGALLALSRTWVDEGISFVASSSTLTVTFQLRDVTKSYHSIDGIRLTAANTVPEPVSLSLAAFGLVACGVVSRRRAQKA